MTAEREPAVVDDGVEPGADEPGLDDEVLWDRAPVSDDESLTPESLEDELEGRAVAPEEDALHETSGAEVWEAIADEGIPLEELDPDDIEANLVEVREADEESLP